MRSEKVMLFDLGGVLVETTGRDVLRELLPSMNDPRVVLERWHRSRAVNLFERGQTSTRVFARAFIKEWELPLSESEFIEFFATWVKGYFDGATALLRSLRAQHRVACLSNTNAVHWLRLPELSELFDSCFASHLTGFMKPDREAYEHALRELRVAADAVYFFDDLELNVTAARAVGINAFHVSGFSEIEPILRAEGLYARTNA